MLASKIWGLVAARGHSFWAGLCRPASGSSSPIGTQAWRGLPITLVRFLGVPAQRYQAANVPLREPARENTRALASRHHACGHETLSLGPTRVGRPNQIYRVDSRRSASSACLL